MTAQLIKKKQYSSDLFLKNGNSIYFLFINWIKDFLKWWYVSMPVWYMMSLRRTITVINDQYSISLLITNFFVPWHRDMSFVGFFIGIVMKLILIPIGLAVLLVVFLAYILFIFFWVLIPVVTILLIFISPFLSIS